MADQMCRDMVNKKRESSGDSSEAVTVSFLGAGGQEISVQCPKVCEPALGLGSVAANLSI